MNKTLLKRAAAIAVSVIAFLFVVLIVHIYIATRPKAPDEHTLVMARIDINEAITKTDADKITTWLYQQKGVNHVLCNPESRIAVFTFFPVKANGNAIVQHLGTELGYKASRYMPSEEELRSGCPVAANSFSGKLASYIKKVF